jgi:hypothetical protein
VRLVRLAQQPSLVAEDIRAALASLGRGNTVVGGIALIGVRPFPDEPTFDAVVVLPRGILTIVGVDLPDPAMRLEAPLQGQWRADGWPLVRGDEINPASKALAVSEKVAKKLTEAHPSAGMVGTVVAVGPFVDRVEQPPADLAGTVRVLHPTPASMLAATVSLATSMHPRSVDQARALVRTLAPDAPEPSDDVLLGEGFSAADDAPTVVFNHSLNIIASTVPAAHRERRLFAIRPAAKAPGEPQVGPPVAALENVAPQPLPATGPAAQPGPGNVAPQPLPATGPAAQPGSGNRPAPVRWLPLAAIGLLAALLIAAILVAANSGGNDQKAHRVAPPAPPVASTSRPVPGIEFTERAYAADQRCASHGFGDVQASLQRTSCVAVRRGSFSVVIDGRRAAATVAIIEFPNSAQATDFKAVADIPGSGGILDIATETGKWPREEVPRFDNAAYSSGQTGPNVRLVEVVWLARPSIPDDPDLVRAAKSALDLAVNS